MDSGRVLNLFMLAESVTVLQHSRMYGHFFLTDQLIDSFKQNTLTFFKKLSFSWCHQLKPSCLCISAGGQCWDVGNHVMCRCRPGFTGPRCETNIDNCASNPCRNAGTCIDRISDFTCMCTLGFGGKDCSVRMSPCDQFPCNNGGTCYTHFTGPVCQCPLGFMGARCEYTVKTTTTTTMTTIPPGNGGSPPALIAAVVLGLVTLTLLVCAAIHILRQLRRGRELRAISTSVKNDLEMVNNRNAVIGGGGPNKGSLPGAPLGSLKEKEAFLISGGQLKVSNKDAALVEKGSDNMAIFKNKMADCNLVKEEQHLAKNKFDL